MVIMMDRLTDTSLKEGLAAMLVLLMVMVPVLAASLLLYLILIFKLIILSIIVMIKTIIVSLLIKHYYYLNTKVELRERTKRTKQLFQILSSSSFFRQMTSVQSRFVWTFVVEKGKTCVEFNCSRIISFYDYIFTNKTIELNNINSSKQQRILKNNNIITNFPYSTSCVAIFFVVVNSLIL